MSSASLPIFTTALGNLGHILDKAQSFVDAKKIDPNALTQYRLAPDMLPFTRQVLIACDAAKNAIARLSGEAAPKFDDVETTLPELKLRVQKTLDYLGGVDPSKVDGSEDKEIVIPVGRDGTTMTMKGEAYLKHWAIPNMYFHVTTAYAILRHNGVELGKADFLQGAHKL